MGFWDNSIVKGIAQGVDRGFAAIGVNDIPFVTNPYSRPPSSPPKPNPPKPPRNETPADSKYNQQYMQGLQSQLAALQAQLAYQPKLPYFDIMANYNRARSKAEQAVNPLYEKYLKDFLAGQEAKRVAKRNQISVQKESIGLELQQALAGSQVERGRTREDVATAIQRNLEQEGQMQQDTGTQFDVDRRTLAEQNAASGLTTSGVGAARIFDQQDMRNVSEERQVKEFSNQRDAKRLFEARTFEDLARGDEDAKAVAANKDKAAQFDLEGYLSELAAREKEFRTENEIKRTSAISQQQGIYAQQGVQEFLNSLAGGGWRPQDIALAYKVYG